MIDGGRSALERKKNERMEQGILKIAVSTLTKMLIHWINFSSFIVSILTGEFVNEDGETVIDEEEFQLITQLKNLKQTYRYILYPFS